MSVERKVEQVSQALERAQGRVEELRDERDALLQANRQLVTLVDAFEDVLKQIEDEYGPIPDMDVDTSEYEYDFTGGWRERDTAHEENLHLEEKIDVDEIKDQLTEIQRTLNSISKYKSEDQA